MENLEKILKATLSEIEKILSTRGVVGDPITIGDNTIVPLSSIGFGFGAGAGRKPRKRRAAARGSAAAGAAASSPWRLSSSTPTAFVSNPSSAPPPMSSTRWEK